MHNKKKLGIIGGMGSIATAYFFDRLVALTPAIIDQEYIETVVHNNTAIPDRTAGILMGKTSPIDELNRSVALLNDFGADYILMACITSHYFVEELQMNSKAAIINIIKETVTMVSKAYPDIGKIGVIASTGAVKLELFQKALAAHDLESVILSDNEQRTYFTEPIYDPWGIKAGFITGKPKERLCRAVNILREKGAELVIAGCSELPLVLKDTTTEIPVIDAIDIGLQKAIQLCLN